MNWRGEKETATVSIIEQKIGEFLRNHTNRLRSGGPSQGTSSESFSTPAQLGQGDKTVCSTRGFQGVLADHLRASRQCVDILRREPQLKMKASEAVFSIWGSYKGFAQTLTARVLIEMTPPPLGGP